MYKRLYYLDYLRVLLTILVILHHTAIAYGAGGSWIFEDVDKSQLTVSSILLTIFTAINQSFFMGLFFFLSGYFTPGSYDRKGWRQFLKDRLLRLGIPLLVYVFVLGPIISYVAHYRNSLTLIEYFQREVITLQTIHIGPLWFVETLLYFSLLYAMYRNFFKSRRTTINITINHKMLLITTLALGVIAFLIRLVSPVGEGILGLQFGYFPSYILLFIAGVIAYRDKWLDALPRNVVQKWGIISIVSIPVLPLGLILTGALEGNIAFEGGWNFQAILYAIWEPFVAIGIILWLLTKFEQINKQSIVGKKLADSAYTVFIIHPAVVVGLSLLLYGIFIHPYLKFLIVGSVGTVLCFVLAYFIIKIPFAKKIL